MSGTDAEDAGGEGGVTAAETTPPAADLEAAGERLILLMKEFRQRQWRHPELVVRAWWTPDFDGEGAPAPNGDPGNGVPSPLRRAGALGFIVEYCPRGVDSAELAVRVDRVRVEGPGGVIEGRLDLRAGWRLDGRDRVCPETLANYLLRMADEVIG